MNNIGYMMSGYDIYYGNPKPTFDIVDPGFRALIFAAEYNGDMTPDYRCQKLIVKNIYSIVNARYCTPAGISVLSCSGSCKLTFNAEFVFGTYSYHEDLSGSVGIGGGMNNASFSASVGWNHVNDMTENGENMITMSEVTFKMAVLMTN